MLHSPRSLLVLSLATLVAACGSTSIGSSEGAAAAPAAAAGSGATTATTAPAPASINTGGSTPPSGTDDLVIATPSQPAVGVVLGAGRPVTIAFTSSDGKPMTGFAISAGAGALPPGWSGPSTFDCATVSSGSGCVLNLTYAPTAAATGTLTVGYVVVDNAGLPRTTGTVGIDYAATLANNVVAAASPTGEIDAVAGSGSRQVTVDFTTDDGNAATQLAFTTDLTTLPAGWSTASPGLSCPVVATGNGCQLVLKYAPSQAGNGTLTLSYAYADDSGAAKTGSLEIPYASTASNTVAAAASPAGQIVAAQKGGAQDVPVTFTTDDGQPATALMVTSPLGALPSGWTSGVSSFSCASVTAGSGCRLDLHFSPATLVNGTLPLTYTYVDDGGTARSGLLDIAYAATTNDNVVGTPAPAGPIDAVVGDAAQTVTVAFTTDDARSATSLAITGGLASLPPGLSAPPGAFTCAGIDADNPCRLELTYAPPAAAAGSLTLTYDYVNNADEPKTGSVTLAFRATTHDTVVATPNPPSVSAVIGTQTAVTVTFATDDGNPASGLTLGAALAALPAGWSSAASTFTCATVGGGDGCTLTLTYSPPAADSGTLNVAFSYLDDSGTPKTGALSLAYSAAP